MQTSCTTEKETDEDGDSVLWDAESIFDPPQHHFKSHAGANSCGNDVQSSNNPLFTPLQSLEDVKEDGGGDDDDDNDEEHDHLSFKSSLSKDMGDCCDSSFSDYLGIGAHSLKGSPISNIHVMAHDLPLGNIMPFPSSPLHGLHHDREGQADHCIMNEALGMSFDFIENPVVMGMMMSGSQHESIGAAGMDFSNVKRRKNGSVCSLSTPPGR
jgi:hypothetical protein